MRKHIVKLIVSLLFCILVLSLIGCKKQGDTNLRMGYSELVYDPNTHIIYYDNGVYGGSVWTPYYSENGNMCRYENGEIIEIP